MWDSLGVDGAGRGVTTNAARSGGDGDYLAQLQQLYADLIEPVAAVLPANQTVVIEPHGPLWLVPFAALRTADGSWLGDRWRLIYAPSSQMLSDIRAEPPFTRPADLKALVIGNPTAPTLTADGDLFRGGRLRAGFSALPGAESEARMIGDLLPESQRKVLLRAAATVDSVTAAMRDITVLHLATHALASASRPLDSFVMLAPGAHSDGRLTARQIMSLSFRADLVTLSACQTGLGQLSGDGVIGLSRAFLVGGARSVLVSQWSVSDQATSFLMGEFYRRYFRGTGDKAEALALAAQQLRRLGYEHPKYWAPFMLVGSEQ